MSKVDEKQFGSVITDKEKVGEAIRRTQKAVLNPSESGGPVHHFALFIGLCLDWSATQPRFWLPSALAGTPATEFEAYQFKDPAAEAASNESKFSKNLVMRDSTALDSPVSCCVHR